MGYSGSLYVLNKYQSTSPSVSRNTQNFDASVDENLANDRDSTSIFSKVLGRELSDSLISDIYLHFHMDFMSNAVGTEATNFVNLGSRPSTHQVNSTPSVPPLLDLKVRQMGPIGLSRVIFFEKLQQTE